jgi:hypothetical protein
MPNRLIQPGVMAFRSDLSQRNQDKAPAVHLRVGNLQLGILNDTISVEQNIEINLSGTPTGALLATQLLFNPL